MELEGRATSKSSPATFIQFAETKGYDRIALGNLPDGAYIALWAEYNEVVQNAKPERHPQ